VVEGLAAPLFPADLIVVVRDGRATGDDTATPVEEAEEAEPVEEPRERRFVPGPFLLFFLGAAGGAVGGSCCSVTVCCRATRLGFFAVVVDPCVDVRWSELGDGGSAFPRACACVAGVSESAPISSAIVSAVGEADEAADARGTSTKSAVSDRGDWRGGDVERMAEEERDQTISSSSEGESLAHLVLEERESTSSEDEREVVIGRGKECGGWGNGKDYLFDRARP